MSEQGQGQENGRQVSGPRVERASSRGGGWLAAANRIRRRGRAGLQNLRDKLSKLSLLTLTMVLRRLQLLELKLLERLRRRLRCRPRVYRIVRARLTTLFEIIPIDAIDCFFTREDARYVELVIFDNKCPPEAIPRSYRRLYIEALERCSSGCTGFNKQPYPKFYDPVRCMKTQTLLILARDVTRRKASREG